MNDKVKHLCQLTASALVAYAAFRWLPLTVWGSMANGLLAFLGLLVAALVQVIPITAGFNQPEHVTPSEARRLGVALEAQQRLWLILLGTSFITAIILVAGVAVTPHTESIPPVAGVTAAPHTEVIPLDSLRLVAAPWFSGAIAFLLLYVATRALLLVPGVLSLQRLRNRLNLEAAKNHEIVRQQKNKATPFASPAAPVTPDSFGRIVPLKENGDAAAR